MTTYCTVSVVQNILCLESSHMFKCFQPDCRERIVFFSIDHTWLLTSFLKLKTDFKKITAKMCILL